MEKPEVVRTTNKSERSICVRYRNPAAAILSTCASFIFWVVYWLAYCLILLAGFVIIFGLLFPRAAWRLLNHSLDQYHVERHFKDEL